MSSTEELHKYIRILLESSDWSNFRFKERDCTTDEKNYHAINIIISSWSALEAFVNIIILISKPAPKLESHEKAFLDEKELKLNDNGEFDAVKAYQSTTKKILFILNRFSNYKTKKFKQNKLWNKIRIAEDHRNTLIHPKSEISGKEYEFKKALFVSETVKEAIKFLNKKILKIRNLPYPV